MSTIPVKPVRLVNESALGIYVLSWTSKAGKRCVVSWFDGLGEPRFEFWSTTRGSMTPPVPIRNPGRFGPWPFRTASHAKTLADFKSFVQRFAGECESDEETS